MKLFYIPFLCFLIACGNSGMVETNTIKNNSGVKYARGFSIMEKNGKSIIEVYNPWDNYKLLAKYELVQGQVTNEINQIEIPVKSVASLSSTYLGMLAMLDARSVLVASSNANWICDSLLFNSYKQGDITNLGNDMNVSAEAVIADMPDVVLKYIYQSPDPIDPVIKNAGIKLVYLIEFMEEHPLGRAEWIKVVGALLDKKQLADSLFDEIEKSYNETKAKAGTIADKPTVVTGSIYKGIWYAAGGKSFIAKLLDDAGAVYLSPDDSTTGSSPLSFEYVLRNQQHADFWINSNANSLQDILNIEPRCEIMNAFKSGNVYHYLKRENPNGGLDYYESGIVRPDLLLKDLVMIFHPELATSEKVYYKKLE